METDWTRRQAVWACEHLWKRADAGDAEVRDEIATAVSAFATDVGENVAICDECEHRDQLVLMGRRWINTGWLPDRDAMSPVDVSLTEDGPAMEIYPLLAESGTAS